MLTPEQHKLRKNTIGGSDAAAVMGLSRYSTPLDIYLEKTSDRVKESNPALVRGSSLEPLVLQLFEVNTGLIVEARDFQISKEHYFMGANIDGYNESESAVVEFKTANARSKVEWGTAGTSEVPMEYLLQVAHYCVVTGASKAYIGVLFGDEVLFKSYQLMKNMLNKEGSNFLLVEGHEYDFHVYVYDRDLELEDRIIAKEKEFWEENVLKQIPPPPRDHSKDVYKVMYKDMVRQEPVTKEEDQVIETYKVMLNKISFLEKSTEREKKKVLSFFGNGNQLVDKDGYIRAIRKNNSVTIFDRNY